MCLIVCLCFGGGCMMGTLFAMSVAALLVVGAQFCYIIIYIYNINYYYLSLLCAYEAFVAVNYGA